MAKEIVCHLEMIATSDDKTFSRARAVDKRVVGTVIATIAMPGEEGECQRLGIIDTRALFLKIVEIHLAREIEVLIVPVEINEDRKRRIQQLMRVGFLPLLKTSKTDGSLWKTRCTARETSICSTPRPVCLRTLEFSQANIYSVVILGHISRDVVKTAIASLHIDLAAEQTLQKTALSMYRGNMQREQVRVRIQKKFSSWCAPPKETAGTCW